MQRIYKQTSDGIGMSEDYICSLFCHVLVLPRLCILFRICTEIFINVFFCISLRFQIIIFRKNETKTSYCFAFYTSVASLLVHCFVCSVLCYAHYISYGNSCYAKQVVLTGCTEHLYCAINCPTSAVLTAFMK